MIGVHLNIGRTPTVHHSVPLLLSRSMFWYIPTYIRSQRSAGDCTVVQHAPHRAVVIDAAALWNTFTVRGHGIRTVLQYELVESFQHALGVFSGEQPAIFRGAVADSSRQECWYDRSQRPAPAYRPGWFPDRLNGRRRHRLVPRCHNTVAVRITIGEGCRTAGLRRTGRCQRVYQSPDRCFQYRHRTRDIPVVEVDHVYVMTLIEALTGPDGRARQPFNQVLPCTLASRKAGLVDSQSFC